MNAQIFFWSVAALLSTGCSRADSWSAPQVQIVASPDGGSIARIVPSGSHDANARAKATILKHSPTTGGYEKVAEFSLRNPVAPHAIVLSDGAEFLVTFDDWAQIGRTANAVVVYRGTGECLRSWSLAEIFSDAERKQFIESVSSTWWRGEVAMVFSARRRPLVLIQPESRMTARDEGRKRGETVVFDLDTLTFNKR